MKKFKNVIKRFELKKIQTDFPNITIKTQNDAVNFIQQFYDDDIEIYESFFILLLNNQLQTIGYAKISQGGIIGTVVDVKIVCKYVIDSLATNVILAHNHPSGSLKYSQQDINITNKIKSAFEFIDSKIFDHIIITKDSYYSFAENNLL